MYRRSILILVALLVLTACGGSAGSTGSGVTTGAAEGAAAGGGATSAGDVVPGSGANAAQAPAAASDKAPGAGGSGAATSKDTTKQSAAQFGRKVILNATLSLQVQKPDETEQKVRALVQQKGGYILKSQTNGEQDRRSVNLTVKVPAANFDEVLNTLESKTFALKVLTRSVSGDDVTDEYVDLESRLRTLRATEARLLDFLKQAKTVEEALQVNQQLTDLQGQIEQASGRRKFLEESTAFSTINLDLQPEAPFAVASTEGWRPGVAATAAWRNLLSFAQGLADVAIVLAVWSPVWGLMLLAGLLARRRLTRRPQAPQPTVQP
jgi:hypothetical protein